MAAWVTHGRADEWVAFQNGKATTRSWARANGCQAFDEADSRNGCRALMQCSEGHPVVWCPWAGNHDWPPFGYDAVWRFFSQF